ncbi:GNAT family N-acetyltransferase [Nocardia sp. 004]|uniref:GNAT family N-acetyltransferase n=1 Tax=Nocardia sp. 004 TaxID=3385978 RepID=UPI0039A2312D
MRIGITTDITEFRSRAESFLLDDPLRHTVLTTIIANYLTGIDTQDETVRFLSVHDEDSSAIGAAIRMAGRDLYLGALPSGSIGAVVRALVEAVPDSAGVEGALDDAHTFAQHWCALTDKEFHQSERITLYRLGALRIPEVAGTPRRAVESDIALCADWMAAMREECGMRQGPDRALIRRRVHAGRWWLWEHDAEPVSLAAHHVPAEGWSRIGPVYTPPHARRHGYAGAVTAHVAKLLRADGLDVCLFADLTNATADRIYRAIGFHPVHEFAHYVFEARRA